MAKYRNTCKDQVRQTGVGCGLSREATNANGNPFVYIAILAQFQPLDAPEVIAHGATAYCGSKEEILRSRL